MPVYLKIEDCRQCPFRYHKGGFGSVGYIPQCKKADKTLPYTVGDNGYGSPVARPKPEIPSWCPLRQNTR